MYRSFYLRFLEWLDSHGVPFNPDDLDSAASFFENLNEFDPKLRDPILAWFRVHGLVEPLNPDSTLPPSSPDSNSDPDIMALHTPSLEDSNLRPDALNFVPDLGLVTDSELNTQREVVSADTSDSGEGEAKDGGTRNQL